MPSDAMIEAVARAMILAQGFDPDEDWSVPEPRHIQSGQSPPPEPAWTTVRNEARAALDAAERAAWLPIEEAPKDGTPVIVSVPDRGNFIIGEAYFDPDDYDTGNWWWAGTSRGDYYADPIVECSGTPTHFRPLPTAPGEQG